MDVENAEFPEEELARATEAEHRRERAKRIKLSILTSILIRPLSVLTPLIVFPLFLKYLGEERYGLYASVSVFAMWFGVTNAGVGLGLTNRLSDCAVRDDRELARRYVSSLTIALVVIGAALLLLFTAVVPLMNWQLIFKSDDPLIARETPMVVWLSGAITLTTLWVNVSYSIYFSYQELHRFNLWDGVNRLLTVAGCIAVTYTNWGVNGVLLASIGITCVVRMVNCFTLFQFEKPWLRPSLRLFEMQLFRNVMTQGVQFLVIQMSVLALYQTDKLIISSTIGTKDVTGYDAIGRLYLGGYALFMIVLAPLWPAHGEALRRGDLAWVRRMLRHSLLIGCGIMTAATVALFFFSGPILRIWTRGDSVEVSRTLVLAVGSMFILRAWVDCRSVVLNGANVLVPQMIVFGGHAFANFALGLTLARHGYGVEGVAWATVITSLLTSTWAYPWIMRRYLWNRADAFPPPTTDANPSVKPA